MSECPVGGEAVSLRRRAGCWLYAHLPITRFLFDQLRVELEAPAEGFTRIAGFGRPAGGGPERASVKRGSR